MHLVRIILLFALVFQKNFFKYKWKKFNEKFALDLTKLRKLILKLANLKLNLEKCNFVETEVKVLGHLVSN